MVLTGFASIRIWPRASRDSYMLLRDDADMEAEVKTILFY